MKAFPIIRFATRTYRNRRRLPWWIALAVPALLLGAPPTVGVAHAATFNVNTSSDTHDAVANGVCADSSGNCSLRAAIEEAVSLGTADTIDLPAGTYTLSLGALVINGGGAVAIQGAGARTTVINQTTANARVFDIVSFGVSAILSGVTVQGGNLNDYGAGVWVNFPAQATLNDVIITGNAGQNGGGLGAGVGTTVTVNRSQISGNTATNGGGLFNTGGTLNVNHSTVSGNNATNRGGGLQNGAGTTTLTGVTLASNVAESDGAGGGQGGGVARSGGTVNIKNTIIADNSVGATGSNPDCAGSIASQDYNLVENTTGCTIANTPDNSILGSDPALEPLADNGGPTNTHGLAVGSLAIDRIATGTNGCGTTYTVDQRGVTRADGGDTGTSCEVGAFEYDSGPTAITLSGTAIRPLDHGRLAAGVAAVALMGLMLLKWLAASATRQAVTAPRRRTKR